MHRLQRESAAISLCRYFRQENALVTIYDPKVPEAQIWMDLTEPGVVDDSIEGESALPAPVACLLLNPSLAVRKQITLAPSAVAACVDAEASVIATEWDEFKELDWASIYAGMKKPAFLFDGRGIVDAKLLRKIGFKVHSVGKGPEIVDPVWA